MPHAHRTARYMQLLRKNPSLPFPALNERRVTAATVREWKMRGRAYDEAQLRLGLVTPAEVQHRNSAVRVVPGQTRVIGQPGGVRPITVDFARPGLTAFTDGAASLQPWRLALVPPRPFRLVLRCRCASRERSLRPTPRALRCASSASRPLTAFAIARAPNPPRRQAGRVWRS